MSHLAIVEALQSACQSQGDIPIVRGRVAVGELIVTHGIEVIEAAAYSHLPLDDDWEYRRLGEVFEIHHQDALRRLVEFGRKSTNPEVVEAADDLDPDRKTWQKTAEPAAPENPDGAPQNPGGLPTSHVPSGESDIRPPEDPKMAAATIARLTLALCLLAAVVEVVLATTSSARLTPGDGIIALFVIGSFILLALFAWRQRGHLTTSWVLLAVAVGMSAWGIYVFGDDSYLYHTDPQYRMIQRMAVFFVPLVQWAVVLAVGLALWVRRLNSRRGSPSNSTGQNVAPGGPPM